MRVFVELAIGRRGVGSFLVEQATCRDFTTAQLNEINHLHPRYKHQTGYSLSDVRITTTDTFKILFPFSLENHSQPSSSCGPLHNHLITYRSHPILRNVKSPTNKQEDVRPFKTTSRCEGTVEIPALNASSPQPRAPTTRSATSRHRRNTYEISPAHQLENSSKAGAPVPRS